MSGLLRQGGFVGVIVLLIVCAAWTAPEAARPQASLVVIEVEEPLSILGKTYPGGRLTLRARNSAASTPIRMERRMPVPKAVKDCLAPASMTAAGMPTATLQPVSPTAVYAVNTESPSLEVV